MRTFSRFSLGLLLPLLVIAQPTPAHAQQENDPVLAEALFNRGKALLRANDWPAACAKFQASLDLDPSVGTLLKIAKCREHEGKLALASYEYQRALKLNRDKSATERRKKELEDFTRSSLAALEPRVPKLRILIANRPAGLKLFRDDQELSLAVLGEVLPVDPGSMEIRAEAPGYQTERRGLTLTEGERSDVELILRADQATVAPVAAAPGPMSVAPEERPVAPAAASREPASPGRAQRVAAVVVGGLGIVSLGVAGAFGLKTLSTVGDSNEFCSAKGCSKEGVDLRNDAAGTQTLSFIFLGAGAAAVVGALALYATAPSPPGARATGAATPRVSFALYPGGLTASGRW